MSLQRVPRAFTAQVQKIRPEKHMAVKAWLRLLIAALMLTFALQAWVIQPIRVDGISMNHTLKNGEIMLVSKWDYLWGDLQRGDVVICRYPDRVERTFPLSASLSLTQHTIFVKRLVALPGDTIEIQNGQLYINGQAAQEPDTLGSMARDMAKRTLGKNEYFVLGDNRFSSRDSRSQDVGALKREMILGKAKWVIWPLNSIRTIE